MNTEPTPPESEEGYVDGRFLVDEYRRYRRIGAIFVLLALTLLIVATIWIALSQPESVPPTTTPDVGMALRLLWL